MYIYIYNFYSILLENVHMASYFHRKLQTKWLSVRLRTKWLWVRVQLQSLKQYPILT